MTCNYALSTRRHVEMSGNSGGTTCVINQIGNAPYVGPPSGPVGGVGGNKCQLNPDLCVAMAGYRNFPKYRTPAMRACNASGGIFVGTVDLYGKVTITCSGPGGRASTLDNNCNMHLYTAPTAPFSTNLTLHLDPIYAGASNLPPISWTSTYGALISAGCDYQNYPSSAGS